MKDIGYIFDRRNIDIEKLKEYGFQSDKNGYRLSKTLDVEGDFSIEIVIGNVKTVCVTDNDFGAEYTLGYSDTAGGAFASIVRTETERILNDIVEKCTTLCAFKSQNALFVINRSAEYGDRLEFPWGGFDDAVIRNRQSGKWYAVIMHVKADRLGFDNDRYIEIINLHTSRAAELIDNKAVFPAYHMNKQHWLSVIGDGEIDPLKLREMIDESYDLSVRKKKNR